MLPRQDTFLSTSPGRKIPTRRLIQRRTTTSAVPWEKYRGLRTYLAEDNEAADSTPSPALPDTAACRPPYKNAVPDPALPPRRSTNSARRDQYPPPLYPDSL